MCRQNATTAMPATVAKQTELIESKVKVLKDIHAFTITIR